MAGVRETQFKTNNEVVNILPHLQWTKALKGTDDERILEEMSPEELTDAFSSNISFGTGGLRGVMGLGTNRLNRYTVQRVTIGLAKKILSSDSPKSVGVAYDTRFNSAEFAEIVCEVLSSYGIDTYYFNKPMPTPVLSHAIRLQSLGWGVCLTASHNPQEYNGYKVYDCNGVQVTDKTAAEITESINSVEFFEPLPDGDKGAVKIFDNKVENAYFEQIVNYVKGLQDKSDKIEEKHSDFRFVYSALHGAGANAVPDVLKKLGFSPICIQQNPDGTFGGLKTPNPEEPVVYEKALLEAEKTGAELLLATDPDCDRVGVMVKTDEGFKLLNGNQIGALLIDYLARVTLEERDTRTVPLSHFIISTIVSGLLGEMVAEDYGFEFVRLLTGFKYIGEYIVNMPEDSEFFFGYEESYGYLAGDGARDKDAVIASALIVEMAYFYRNALPRERDIRKTVPLSLFERLEELSEKYGYCLESLHSLNISQVEQKEMMAKLRSKADIEGVTRLTDYLPGVEGLPCADVIKLYFAGNDKTMYNNAWAAIRPSGTEPKLKLYTGVHASTQEAAEDSLKQLEDKMLALLSTNQTKSKA